MRLTKVAALSLALAAAPLVANAAVQPPANVAAAVAGPGRTADNVKLDESRKPEEVLQFLGLRQQRRGMREGRRQGHRVYGELTNSVDADAGSSATPVSPRPAPMSR